METVKEYEEVIPSEVKPEREAPRAVYEDGQKSVEADRGGAQNGADGVCEAANAEKTERTAVENPVEAPAANTDGLTARAAERVVEASTKEAARQSLDNIIEAQRKHFKSGITQDVEWRRGQLIHLKQAIKEKTGAILEAFATDLNKSEFDVYMTELGPVLSELDFMLKKLTKLTKPQRVRVGLMNLFSRGELVPEPYGVTLIVSPFNYPLNLALTPLVGAIAAGNTAIVKPSPLTPRVSSVIGEILKGFDKRHVCVINGKSKESEVLFEGKYDFVFFTGGVNAAKSLAESLAKSLTPSIMELGGKSPCIVAADADIDKAARRIVWGKYLNAGQTCVAPDFALVHSSVHEQFLKRVKHYIDKFYYNKRTLTDQFVHVVNDSRAERLIRLIEKSYVVCGGARRGRLIEPTVVDKVLPGDPIMQEEIFGPILPILTFESTKEAVDLLLDTDKPLALYYFGRSDADFKEILRRIPFGGGCFNDVILHAVERNLPFGGVGSSGHGSYHGKKTFEAFTHYKSVLYKKGNDVKQRYMPYTAKKIKTIKKFFKSGD